MIKVKKNYTNNSELTKQCEYDRLALATKMKLNEIINNKKPITESK